MSKKEAGGVICRVFDCGGLLGGLDTTNTGDTLLVR